MRTPELTLDQMLSDTIVQLVMRRDGLTEHCVRDVIDRARRAREERLAAAISEAA
jgi:hypothetical protein